MYRPEFDFFHYENLKLLVANYLDFKTSIEDNKDYLESVSHLILLDEDQFESGFSKNLRENSDLKKLIVTNSDPVNSVNNVEFEKFTKIKRIEVPINDVKDVCFKARQIFIHLDYDLKKSIFLVWP